VKKRDEASRGEAAYGAVSRYLRSNVLGLVAISIALGGTAYATHPGGQNTISSSDIINNEVRTEDLRDGAVNAADLRTDSVITGKIADGAVTARKLGCRGNGSGDEMVKAGAVCIDRYEASIWDAPEGGTQITGAVPCNANGQDCDDIFARSVPGVAASSQITWFQAQQALANVGKRLPTNAEWQQAVAGTPDSTACNVATAAVADTGANPGCVSRFGAFDMVGNLREWVADWDEQALDCANWPAGFGDDFSCIGRGSGEASTRFPGALLRGGNFFYSTLAGPFTVEASNSPSSLSNGIGFRGAR
jgi:Sulfatase-modifying factor enzyme 1